MGCSGEDLESCCGTFSQSWPSGRQVWGGTGQWEGAEYLEGVGHGDPCGRPSRRRKSRCLERDASVWSPMVTCSGTCSGRQLLD